MANLTIKDLPDGVHEEIKSAARAEGRSMNGYLVELLKSTVEEHARRRTMREGRAEFRRFVTGLKGLSDSTPLLRDDRER